MTNDVEKIILILENRRKKKQKQGEFREDKMIFYENFFRKALFRERERKYNFCSMTASAWSINEEKKSIS